MNKQEFESILGRTVSEEDYKVIEYVYTWHPAISNVNGKDQMVAIYAAGGITVIKNMCETARFAMNIESEEEELRRKMNKLKKRRELLETGDITYELCREEVEQAYTLADSVKDYEKMLIPLQEKLGEEMVRQAAKDLELNLNIW